ncbi:hypothetical protein [Amycolatopsis sp. NPDC098790]|uniref:hypothetical protein n=1 Tax=Amycolatopsis sp. NPDC098790 TaxID=3363939 RepID=UPI0037F255C2
MSTNQTSVTPPPADGNDPQPAATDPAKRSMPETVKEIAPFVTVLGAAPAAVTCLNFAQAHNIWPYSDNPVQGLLVGTGLVVVSLVTTIWAIAKKKLTTWLLLIGVLTGSVGSILTTVSIFNLNRPSISTPAPGPSASTETSLKIQSPEGNQRMTGPFELQGTFLTPLRPGDTLWVFANDGGNPDADRSKKFTLLRGLCSVDVGNNTFKCPITLAQDKKTDRTVTLTVLSVTATQARNFVQDLYSGGQLDQNRTDCANGRCALANRSDPRDKIGLPGGDGVTVTDHRTVIIPKP